mgnify:CR=1 FL=1
MPNNKREFKPKILAKNLSYLQKKHNIKFDNEAGGIGYNTFKHYVQEDSIPSIRILVKFISKLGDPHNRCSIDDMIFKDLVPKEGDWDSSKNPKISNMFKNKKTKIRDKEAITDKEYNFVVNKQHSQEDLDWINSDDGFVGSSYEGIEDLAPSSDVSTGDLRAVDKACQTYLKSVGLQKDWNPRSYKKK